MDELNVRRARNFQITRGQAMNQPEKTAGAARSQQAPAARSNPGSDLVSETLQKLMGRMDRVGQQARAGRQTLHAGEAALAEIDKTLGQMEELARQAIRENSSHADALQGELDRLLGELDRIVQNGVREGLFQDGDGAQGDELVDALLSGLEAQRAREQALPAWLLKGMTGPAPDRAALLSALGLDSSASGPELLAALGNLPLDDRTAGYLAGLYLGAVISGGAPGGEIDPEQAAQGLQRLLELVSRGVDPDHAVELLTGGLFSGMEDFQAQFAAGTAPGLEDFLTALLLSEAEEQIPSLAGLLAGGGEGEVDLLMDLLLALDSSGKGMELLDGTANPAQSEEGASLPQWESAQLGTVLASGQNLEGVSLDPDSGEVIAGGGEALVLRGMAREEGNPSQSLQSTQEANPSLPSQPTLVRLTGGGTVSLQNLNLSLRVDVPQAKVLLAGNAALEEIILGKDTLLTLESGGPVRLGAVRGEGTLRLTGGAFTLPEDAQGFRVVVDGPVSLLAAGNVLVQDPQGARLSPLDILWKSMLPGWSALTSLMVDGKQRPLALTGEDPSLRLWLLRGNDSQGYPAHSVLLQGRDRAGNVKVQYAYVRWDQQSKSFREITMYPNPFTVTGGEADTDWQYDEHSQTLTILSAQVRALSGGSGTDGDQQPFSGRLALADGIGTVELTLEGVECRVSSGGAFRLGEQNRVALLLQPGSENVFESGPGFAGISLGAGTSLRIDRVKGGPEGKLTALGGAGGAGIGRDSGAGRDRCGEILIQGGTVVAVGAGGGAGIGGALGAGAGDIRVQGGTVTARASCSAAAIGAGIQGGCGEITITSFAHISDSRGGGPDGDIGGCLFGSCGRLRVSSGADLGGAKLWNQEGLSLQVGESTLTMPKFRVSACALRLDGASLSTRQAAQAALAALSAGRRWVERLQGAYGVMYGQLAQSVSGLHSPGQFSGVVREDQIADLLLRDARQTLRQDPLAPYRLRAMENVGLLLR